jgi:adenylate kinase family enzyme
LLIITGPPGAGKSTVARLVSAGFGRSVLVTGDSFFGFLDQGAIPPWRPESAQQNDVVTEAAALSAGRFARAGYAVVYDGVIGPWYLRRFADTAAVSALHYVILLPDEATCVDRVATRRGHGFTDADATRHMHREFVAAGPSARHVLAPPPDDPVAVARLVRSRFDAGELAVTEATVQPR